MYNKFINRVWCTYVSNDGFNRKWYKFVSSVFNDRMWYTFECNGVDHVWCTSKRDIIINTLIPIVQMDETYLPHRLMAT